MQGELSRSKNVVSRSRGWFKCVAAILTIGLGLAAGAATADPLSPVFRFYNTATGTHFYTIETAERDNIIRLYPSFAFEGVAFYAYKTQSAGSKPVFRFYNRSTNTHFYTISQSDKDYVLANFPVFSFEGSAYYAMATPATGSENLYRFYNRLTGAHFYTTSVPDRDYVKATWPWFADEGVAFQVFADATPGGGGGGGPGGGPAPTATLLMSSTNPSTVGGSVTFVATVNGAAPSGTVNFTDNGVAMAGCSSLPLAVNGTLGSASCSTSSLTVGNHMILVSYGGDAANSPSSTTLIEVINGSGGAGVSTTAVTSSANPATAGNTVTFTASVTGNSPTGTVTFTDGGASIGCNSRPLSGTATCATAALAVGTHNIMASYSGDAGNMASSGSVFQVINPSGGGGPGTTTTTLSSSMNPQAVGISVVFTATVNGTNPTGSVLFTAGGTTLSGCGAVTFAAGTGNSRIAQCSNSTLPVGTSAIVAKYSGDANNLTSTSATFSQTVTGTPPALVPKVAFTLSNTLLIAPQSVSITATATETGGTITKVSLYLNGAKLVDLTASPYTFTTSALGAGTHVIYATATDALGTITSTLPQNVIAISGPPPVVTQSADIWRLLNQATFGASQAEAAKVLSMGIGNWIDNQFTRPISGYPDTKYNQITLKSTLTCNTQDPQGKNYPADSPQAICARDHLTLTGIQRDFFTNGLTAQDQLRQRVAFALSQILVTSGNEPDLSYAYVMSRYQNIMFNNAFGNFKTMLQQITLSPAMGNYLDMVNSDRTNGTRVPNENYAREIMQLFSVGLDELNDDGSTIDDAMGNPIPTYDQNTIKEFAKVFTGYTYADPANPTAPATKKNPVYYAANMVTYPTTGTTGHEMSAKQLLSYTSSVPASTGVVVAGQTPQQDLDSAVQNVFDHPNTPPYISRQLIQRLVTGNPSPAYVARISGVFKNNGSGVRGDMKAVVKAILMDTEARGPAKTAADFGSLREPVLAVTAVIRALNGISDGNRLATATNNLGQNPYFSPTVFNYFPPDATIPGTTTLAPEFAIHTTNSAVSRANLMYTLVYNGYAPDPTIPSAVGTRLDLSQFSALASNPTAMVARYSDVLTGGQLDPAAQAIVVTAVTAVPVSATPTAAQLLARAQMGAYLILSSYHFQVQR
ncbi:MAG: DUF1800 family protein [Betaproteobacteria bacterium]